MSQSLDNLLFGDDDSGDDLNARNSNSSTSGSIIPPPAAATAIPPPAIVQQGTPLSAPIAVSTPPPVKDASSESLVKKMFALLQQRISEEKFQQLRSSLPFYGHDTKLVLSEIRRIAGEDTVHAILFEIQSGRSAAAPVTNSPVMQASMAAKPVPTKPATAQPIAAPATITKLPLQEDYKSMKDKVALEQWQYEQLFVHAISCPTPFGGNCEIYLCDNIRMLVNHVKACTLQKDKCEHCVKLHAMVNFHVNLCTVPPMGNCKVPFCDERRRGGGIQLPSTARIGSTTNSATTPASARFTSASMGGTTTTSSFATPVPSAIKSEPIKAEPAKAVAAAAKTMFTNSPTSGADAKAKPKPPAKAVPTATGAKGAGEEPAKKQQMTTMYGEVLQIVLHAQKCTQAECPVIGPRCKEAKYLLTQINEPSGPPRSKTYKQVLDHYRVCTKQKKCPVCVIGLQPLVPMKAAPTIEKPQDAALNAAAPKRPRGTFTPKGASAKAIATVRKEELIGVSAGDIRKEGDVLTHTAVDLNSEKKMMLMGAAAVAGDISLRNQPDQLKLKRDEWAVNNLFIDSRLAQRMQQIAAKQGVAVANSSCEYISRALDVYLRQILEDMVAISKHRCNCELRKLESVSRRKLRFSREPSVLHTIHSAYDKDFMEIEANFGELKKRLLEDGEHDEAERDKGKKRKKADKLKQEKAVERPEKPEKDMDIEELATKDLKTRLNSGHDSNSAVHRSRPPTDSSAYLNENKITPQDAMFWLTSQVPAVNPKLFCRADAALISSNSL